MSIIKNSTHSLADGHGFFRHGLGVGHVVFHDGLEELIFVLPIERWLKMETNSVSQSSCKRWV